MRSSYSDLFQCDDPDVVLCSFWHRAAFIMRPREPRSPPVQVAWFAAQPDLRYSLRLLYFLLINIIEYELLMWCNLIICEYEFT